MHETVPKPIQIGRPRNDTAESHSAIMDAVYELLQEKSARDLTMEAIAKRAGVGKPTLYKWWPSKAALILAMFHERLEGKPVDSSSDSAEASLRAKVSRLVMDFNGLFGKVMADLIGEAQSNPELLNEIHGRIKARRAVVVAEVEMATASGEFHPDTDAEIVVDTVFGPAYYRLLLGFAPLTREYGDALIEQVLRGIRPTGGALKHSQNKSIQNR